MPGVAKISEFGKKHELAPEAEDRVEKILLEEAEE